MGAIAAAIGLGVAGLGTGIASAATAQGPKFYGPEESTRKNVVAQMLYGPSVWQLNRLYNPAYANLGNSTTQNTLFGTDPRSVNKLVTAYHDGRRVTFRQRMQVPGQMGLLDIYKKAGNQMADYNRNQTLKDLAFAPQAMQGYLNANPLLGSIANRAQEGLDQGGSLDASTRRQLQQSSFQDASMRGFGHSPLDAYMAYTSMGAEAEARKRQREQFALQAQGAMPDPFTLARSPSLGTTLGPSLGMGGAAWGRTSSAPIINPFSSMNVQSVPQDNTTSNILGAISGGLLSMGGGMMGMGGGGGAGARQPQSAGYQPTAQVGPRLY
jgi:hypothetical protein